MFFYIHVLRKGGGQNSDLSWAKSGTLCSANISCSLIQLILILQDIFFILKQVAFPLHCLDIRVGKLLYCQKKKWICVFIHLFGGPQELDLPTLVDFCTLFYTWLHIHSILPVFFNFVKTNSSYGTGDPDRMI